MDHINLNHWPFYYVNKFVADIRIQRRLFLTKFFKYFHVHPPDRVLVFRFNSYHHFFSQLPPKYPWKNPICASIFSWCNILCSNSLKSLSRPLKMMSKVLSCNFLDSIEEEWDMGHETKLANIMLGIGPASLVQDADADKLRFWTANG